MRRCILFLLFHCVSAWTLCLGIVKSASKHAVLLGGEWMDPSHFTPRTIRTHAFYFSQFLETINQPYITRGPVLYGRRERMRGTADDTLLRACRKAFNKRHEWKSLPHMPGSSKQLWWFDTVISGTFFGRRSKARTIMCLLYTVVLFSHS